MNEFFLEFLLKVVLGSLSDVECTIQLGNDIGFFFGKIYFLIRGIITIVLPYSSFPLILRRASMAEFMSLKTINACPLILMFFLATI